MPSNAELIDRLFTLSNRCAIGDASAFTELVAAYDDHAQITSMLDLVQNGNGGTPAEAIRTYFERVSSTCYVWIIYADQIQEHGDHVLALGGIRTVKKGSRDDRETPVGWVFQVKAGKVVAVHAYRTYEAAQAAVRAS